MPKTVEGIELLTVPVPIAVPAGPACLAAAADSAAPAATSAVSAAAAAPSLVNAAKDAYAPRYVQH